MKRPFLVPEVLQTSGMDCGPAALKALFAGLGIHVSYEKLREACRTGADGTSIDALEDICLGLGLEAFQELAPRSEAIEILRKAAPAIVVVQGAGGSYHFVVLWRIVGSWVQLMDPTRGRRWVHVSIFVSELREHTQPFDEEVLSQWFGSTLWGELTNARLARLGSEWLTRDADTWEELAALEGGSRLAHGLVEKGLLPKSGARKLLGELLPGTDAVLPDRYRAITKRAGDGALTVTGVVFLRVRRTESTQPAATPLARKILAPDQPSPWRTLYGFLSANARRTAGLVLVLSFFLATLTYVEMLFLRAAFNAGSALSLPQQRFWGTAMYAGIVGGLLALEYGVGASVARLGRALEIRCRHALLDKLPKLPDRYFRTRPMSDVTHRSQGIFTLRGLPTTLVSLCKTALELVVTTIAIVSLHPRGAGWAALALGFGLVVPVLLLRFRSQFEQRVQSHASGLSQLYLDVLLGLGPIQTHGGHLSMRARQDELLADWHEESRRTVAVLGLTDGLQQVGTLLAVFGILFSVIRGGTEPGVLLVLTFWALKLPVQARTLSGILQRMPQVIAYVSRLVEPLTAEETPKPAPATESTIILSRRPGIALEVRNAKAVLGTHEVLSNVSVKFNPGEHVAIVGNSGAGKSSLIAAILGLVDLDEGEVRVDGVPVAAYDLARLRRETVWVDPSVQLWNRSLHENLLFGNPPETVGQMSAAIERTDLKGLLERLETGMGTPLGESGVRVSGGEGQRVRLSRALLRRGARLMLLDEAFRGLDRKTRRRLSSTVRGAARETTVIEVTHDVADTMDFDRVLVVENGVLVEDGKPTELAADATSRFHALALADREVQELWNDPRWKRVVVGESVRVLEPEAAS